MHLRIFCPTLTPLPRKNDKGIRSRPAWDFPGGPVVKNPPSNAGDTGLIPDRGTKIPHAAGQLILCATSTEPEHLNYRARTPQTTEPTFSGACVLQLEERKAARHNQREACVPQRRPDAAKKKKKKKKKKRAGRNSSWFSTFSTLFRKVTLWSLLFTMSEF